MDQASSVMRLLLIIAGVLLLATAFVLLYGWFFGNKPTGAPETSKVLDSSANVDDVVARVLENEVNDLKERYNTVVKIQDYAFVPDSIVVNMGEEVAFYTPDLQTYQTSMQGKKLFTIQRLVEGVTRVSAFIFPPREGVYTMEVVAPDGSQKGTLTVTVQP